MPILITSSRRPTRRTRRFIKELCRVNPQFMRINRGKMSYSQLRNYMISRGLTKIIFVENIKGNPGILEFMKLSEKFLIRVLSIKIENLSLQIDVKKEITLSSLVEVNITGIIDEDLKNILMDFYYPYTSLMDGEIGKLLIHVKNNKIEFKYLDEKGNRIYPYIKGEIKVYTLDN